MRTVLLFILFLLFGKFQLAAQNFQWVRVDSSYAHYSYNPSFPPNNLIFDGNGLIYKLSTLDYSSSYYFDSTTSTSSRVPYATLITVQNSSGKLIKRSLIPGYVLSAVMDKKGNLYCTGYFEDKYDFDPGKGSSVLNSDGESDCFILKYNASGKLILALRIGGTNHDYGKYLEVDNDFNMNITGTFSGLVDFDPGASTYKINGGGIFNLKLDSTGKFISVKTKQSYPIKRIRDTRGNIYNIGAFRNKTDFDPDSVKTFYLTSIGNSDDIYIQKLDPYGRFIWVKSLGGKQNDAIHSIAIDQWQNVYTTGSFEDSIDLDPGSKYYYLESKGKTDVFMSKLDSMGNFVWGLTVGNTGLDFGNIVALDDSANVYFGGFYQDSVDFDPGSNQYKLFGNSNTEIFILKLNPSGKFLWAKTWVNKSYKAFVAISIDKQSNIYLAGYFSGTLDFDPDSAKYEKIGSYDRNPFLLKLGPCPSPAESTISGPSILCGKEKKGVYSVTQSSGAKAYIWRVPKGAKIDSGQGSNKIYVTFDTILGEISVRPTNICDTSMYSVLNVKRLTILPNVLAYSNLTKICKGEYIYLYGGGNANTYVWNKGVKNYAYFYPDSTDTYIVTGTDKNGCTAKDTISIIVGAKSPASIKGSTAVCKNGKASYSVNPTPEAKGYFWGVPSDAKIDSGQNTSTIYVTFGSASGNISAIPNNACTTNPTLIYISVENLTIGTNVSPSSSICKGTSVTLSGTGGASYKWSGGVINGVAFKPDSTTKYILSATGNNGCIIKDSVIINVGVNPPSSINGPGIACNGGKATYSVVPIPGAKGYIWSVPNNAIIDSGQNTSTIYIRFGSASGNISIIPVNACGSNKTDKYVTVTTVSIGVNVSPPTATVCKGSPVILKGTGGTNYTWSGGVKDGLPFIPDTTATYNVTGSDANGCSGTSSFTIKVAKKPAIMLQPLSQTQSIGNSVKFITSSSSVNATFQWQQNAGIGFTDLFDAGPYSGTNSDTLNINAITLSQNNFKYRCIAMDGCTDTSKTASLFVKTGGILTSNYKQNLVVYPNPSVDYIIIESGELLNKEPYLISDQVGRVILKGELNYKLNQLNLSGLAKGFYLLKIGDEKSQTFKIQKL